MGIWIVTYKMKRESFPRIFEVGENKIPLSKRENMKDGYEAVIDEFKKTFQEDIDRGNITEINAMYCFQYGKTYVSDLKSVRPSASEALF